MMAGLAGQSKGREGTWCMNPSAAQHQGMVLLPLAKTLQGLSCSKSFWSSAERLRGRIRWEVDQDSSGQLPCKNGHRGGLTQHAVGKKEPGSS